MNLSNSLSFVKNFLPTSNDVMLEKIFATCHVFSLFYWLNKANRTYIKYPSFYYLPMIMSTTAPIFDTFTKYNNASSCYNPFKFLSYNKIGSMVRGILSSNISESLKLIKLERQMVVSSLLNKFFNNRDMIFVSTNNLLLF
jgi:hypothetical protein